MWVNHIIVIDASFHERTWVVLVFVFIFLVQPYGDILLLCSSLSLNNSFFCSDMTETWRRTETEPKRNLGESSRPIWKVFGLGFGFLRSLGISTVVGMFCIGNYVPTDTDFSHRKESPCQQSAWKKSNYDCRGFRCSRFFVTGFNRWW